MQTHQKHHPCRGLICDEIHNFFLAIFQGHGKRVPREKSLQKINILQKNLGIDFTLKVFSKSDKYYLIFDSMDFCLDKIRLFVSYEYHESCKIKSRAKCFP